MTRNKLLTLVLVVAVASSAAAVPAAAQDSTDDGSFFDPLVTESGEPGWVSSMVLDLTSGASRLYTEYTSDPGNATGYAEDVTATFNADNESIAAYASDRLDADTDHDVFAVYFHDRAGNNVTRYVVSTVDAGNYTNARMLTPAEFNDTGRSTDDAVDLDWYASKNMNSELETFVEEYASTGDNLSRSYRARMLAKYGGGVSSGLWNQGGS